MFGVPIGNPKNDSRCFNGGGSDGAGRSGIIFVAPG